jgi:hypothetical protein
MLFGFTVCTLDANFSSEQFTQNYQNYQEGWENLKICRKTEVKARNFEAGTFSYNKEIILRFAAKPEGMNFNVIEF